MLSGRALDGATVPLPAWVGVQEGGVPVSRDRPRIPSPGFGTAVVVISDAALCAAAAVAYASAATVAVGDVHAVLSRVDGLTVVAFRGTVPSSWADWFRDIDAVPTPVRDHPRLGLCHRGFADGAEAILPLLLPLISGPVALTGHSLGGALAIAAAALLADLGRPPSVLTTFGAPRVGIGGRLAELLAAVSGRLYRNGDDPVPEIPIWPFRHHRALTGLGLPALDAIGCHFIAAYAAGLGNGVIA